MFSKLPELPKEGAKVLLRRIESRDLDELYSIESDPEIKRYVDGPVKLPRSEWIHRMESKLTNLLTIAVECKADHQLAGRAAIAHTSLNNECELQVVLAKAYWGCRLGRETAEMLIAAAFSELGSEQVVGVVHPENEKSLDLLRSLGFQRVGEISDNSSQNGHLKFAVTHPHFYDHYQTETT